MPFIRDVLRVAWAMVALDPPIDLPAALEGDVINETRYRRTFDSEFSATTTVSYTHLTLPTIYSV